MEKIIEKKVSSQICRENWTRYKTVLKEHSEGFGELYEKKMNVMEKLLCKYVYLTLKAVEMRFKFNDIMSSLKFFENTAAPEKIDDNSEFETSDIKILNIQFWKLSVVLTVPMSSAWAERGFSQMNIIKTDLGSMLTE
ncbi:MAG: hypothetical protein EZS28_023653 [Streblomastix strix]|uniref:Uncharacterized protein n=1 Tax=Streblomastix strix TaxID=222440 RepID=A0A5J4VE15_9EUKA|nr:MAG: hypothetical protein EZS28_023653 [Streblomastix strix]